jgi:carbonic anhydrase/acetyltransferase-like protein (isoleucine patch superfamily)
MKFKKQIFTILILALLVVLAASASAGNNGAVENIKSAFGFPSIMNNAKTPWNPVTTAPVIDRTAYIHPEASVIGAVKIGANVIVAPFASVRGDEGMPIFIGDNSNVQDGVVVHGLETIDENLKPVTKNTVTVNGKNYSVYVGRNVSLAHQSQVHGPALVGNDTFIGMQAFVFKSHVGNGCVLEPKSAAVGVNVANGKYIPAGEVVTTQAQADALPNIFEGYAYQHTNEAVVYVNTNLARGYNKAALH